MPDSHFIPFKHMEGELLISQKRDQLRLSLTTKELIFQKPHTTVQIMLEDILGIVPFHLPKAPTPRIFGETVIHPRFASRYHRISARRCIVINRNGRFERGSTDILIPLNDRFIRHIDLHSDFISIPTR